MEFIDLGIKTESGRLNYYTTCPKCEPTRKHKGKKSLTVHDEVGNRWYKCHNSGCEFSGNLDIMDKFKQVYEKSRMPARIPESYSLEVREYFQGRGIDPKTAQREKVFEFSVGGKPRVGFPHYINMTLVNVKYLNIRWRHGDDSPKWYQMNKEYGTRSIFWGMQSIKFDTEDEETKLPKILIITEGEIDALTWKQCRYNNTVSVPMGAPNPKAKNFEHEFDYVSDPYVKSFFEDIDLIIFSTDNDNPGKVLREQLALRFGKEKCKYIHYPVGYKDINEVFNGNKKAEPPLPALGQEGVDECYQNLSSFAVKGIIRPSDVRDDLERYAKEGFVKGLGIGVPEIDRLYTLKAPQISFITGIPGSGKSVYVRWYLAEFIRYNIKLNIKWALFTPENRPVAREYAKLAEALTGMSFKEGLRNSMPSDLRAKTMRLMEKHFFIISPDKMNFETWNGKISANRVNGMESILKYLEYLKTTENIFGYVIDAWNKIEHEQPKYMTETSFISQQLDYLINFNDVYNVHGIVIVHPKKIDQQGANYKMPSLYDIKGSSAWKEKADIGIILHRYKMKKKDNVEIPKGADEDEKYYVVHDAPTIVRTEKIRFEEIGIEDRIRLKMDPAKGGRFFVDKNYKPSTKDEDGPKKLNPKIEEEEEELPTVFQGTGDDLPF
jgi:twinkle protein